ncbi:MAG TPA: STAS domain-containing protein [Candidatus Acidoferrum sp.]|nr:STAS domain-containing protein [Candidatus Acidoferrum sp.]
MNLSDRLDGDVAIIDLGGRLVSCEELRVFQDKIRAYLDSDVRRFVIDLSGVENTGSEGLGSLIAAYTSVRKADGRFVLANINNVRNLLTITRLYGVFEAYGSRAEALKAVRS